MNRAQIIIVALLATMALGIFAVLGYLLLANRQPAATSAPPTAAAMAANTTVPVATSATRRPTPSPTPSRWPGATAANAEQAKSIAQATLKAGGAATSEAQGKIQAILRQMPANDINLSAENGRLNLTIVRMVWLGPGSLAIKLKATNLGQEKLAFNLPALSVKDAKGGQSVRDATASGTLPGALTATELAPGASAEGQVAFKLPLQTAPAALIYNDGVVDALEIDIMAWIMLQPKPTATPAK